MRYIAVFALLLVACACSSAKPKSSSAPSATTTTTASPAPSLCSVPGNTDTKKATSSDATAAVTDVRYSDTGCARVVFQFTDHTPGYEIGYASPPFSDCGSGATVATTSWGADNYLQIKLTPSGGVDLSKGPNPTYTGSRDITVSGATLKHLKVTCDFEAVFTWIAGLHGKHPFTVQTMDNPPRLVLNIRSN